MNGYVNQDVLLIDANRDGVLDSHQIINGLQHYVNEGLAEAANFYYTPENVVVE